MKVQEKKYKKNEMSWFQGQKGLNAEVGESKKRNNDLFLKDPEQSMKVFNHIMKDHNTEGAGESTSGEASGGDGGAAAGGCSESIKSRGTKMTNKQIREMLNKVDHKILDEGGKFYDFVSMFDAKVFNEAINNREAEAILNTASNILHDNGRLSDGDKERLAQELQPAEEKKNSQNSRYNRYDNPENQRYGSNAPQARVAETLDIEDLDSICEEEELEEGRHDLEPKKCVSLETHTTYWSPWDKKEKDFAKFGIRYRYEDRDACLDAINDPENDLGYNKKKKKAEKDAELEQEVATESLNTTINESVYLHIDGEKDKQYKNFKTAKKIADTFDKPWEIYTYDELGGKNHIDSSDDSDEDIDNDNGATNVSNNTSSKGLIIQPGDIGGNLIDKTDKFFSASPLPAAACKPAYLDSDGVVDIEKLKNPKKKDGNLVKIDAYWVLIFRLYYLTFVEHKKSLNWKDFAISCGVPNVFHGSSSAGSQYKNQLEYDGFLYKLNDDDVIGTCAVNNPANNEYAPSNKAKTSYNLKDFIEQGLFEPGHSAQKADGSAHKEIINPYEIKDRKTKAIKGTVKIRLKDIVEDEDFKKLFAPTLSQRAGGTKGSNAHDNAKENQYAEEARKKGYTDPDEIKRYVERKMSEEDDFNDERENPFAIGDFSKPESTPEPEDEPEDELEDEPEDENTDTDDGRVTSLDDDDDDWDWNLSDDDFSDDDLKEAYTSPDYSNYFANEPISYASQMSYPEKRRLIDAFKYYFDAKSDEDLLCGYYLSNGNFMEFSVKCPTYGFNQISDVFKEFTDSMQDKGEF